MLLEWDPAITSTIYDSIASSMVSKVCFVHTWGHLSQNLSTKIQELITSWCSMSRTVRTNSLADHGGFPWWVAINFSHSAQHTPAVHLIVSWLPSTSTRIYSHPIACCFWLLLLLVYEPSVNICHGSCCRWLRLQCHGGLTRISIAAVFQYVPNWTKHLSFGSIQIQPCLAEVSVVPCLAVVEMWGRW